MRRVLPYGREPNRLHNKRVTRRSSAECTVMAQCCAAGLGLGPAVGSLRLSEGLAALGPLNDILIFIVYSGADLEEARFLDYTG